jgi:hypothetical protein
MKRRAAQPASAMTTTTTSSYPSPSNNLTTATTTLPLLSLHDAKRIRSTYSEFGKSKAVSELRSTLGNQSNPELEYEIMRLIEEEQNYLKQKRYEELEPPDDYDYFYNNDDIDDPELLNINSNNNNNNVINENGIFCLRCCSSSSLKCHGSCTFSCSCGLVLYDAQIVTLENLRLVMEQVLNQHTQYAQTVGCPKTLCDIIFNMQGESWVMCYECEWKMQITRGSQVFL